MPLGLSVAWTHLSWQTWQVLVLVLVRCRLCPMCSELQLHCHWSGICWWSRFQLGLSDVQWTAGWENPQPSPSWNHTIHHFMCYFDGPVRLRIPRAWRGFSGCACEPENSHIKHSEVKVCFSKVHNEVQRGRVVKLCIVQWSIRVWPCVRRLAHISGILTPRQREAWTQMGREPCEPVFRFLSLQRLWSEADQSQHSSVSP